MGHWNYTGGKERVKRVHPKKPPKSQKAVKKPEILAHTSTDTF
jgi:hypothetical protein